MRAAYVAHCRLWVTRGGLSHRPYPSAWEKRCQEPFRLGVWITAGKTVSGTFPPGRFDHGGARYEAALPIYRRVGAVLGEANCIQRLGDTA